MAEPTSWRARILHDITELPAAQWNALANPPGQAHHPFVRHEFLAALEASGSVGREAGWQPFHLAVEPDVEGASPLGVVPLYLKSHSQGEYVFDYGWADAWHRAGGQYYPKLQCSIPFTPATGPRLLVGGAGADREELLLDAMAGVAREVGVSSLHITFMEQPLWDRAGRQGYLQRMDQQFHWHNPGYACFDDFLAELASKKRKNLKRERRDAVANDIEIEWVTGADLTEAHWDAFYRFYLDTGSRKWGSPYLTREFFSLASASMSEDILLILCKRNGTYIAGALNFIGGDTLYGRNWGCTEHHPFLHFETCYYQAIDFAIERGLARVEAGAQGGHKVARGYLPQATYSAHWIENEGFREAIDEYLARERSHVSEDIGFVEEQTPFRSDVDLDELRHNAATVTGGSAVEPEEP
ncbi:MAG: GNAT family N-acetyltransferase [Pseudomonadota bacterium]